MKLSCEFFPPKTEKGLQHLLDAADQLQLLRPEFFSVTYGAGGTSRSRTLVTVEHLQSRVDAPIVPHLTCIGSKKSTIKNLLNRYKQKNIRRIIALRGDYPEDEAQLDGDFSYASDLVEFIREETGDYFHIDVAAYPEFHPEAKNPSHDLINFKRKVDAGANRAVTQYFFSFDAFSYFMDDCEKMGITIPVVPGIIPILNWPQLVKFSNLCGTDLPTWLHKRMRSYGEDVQAMQDYGVELVTHLCEKLIAFGVPGFHFYTLNKSDLTLRVCKNLGLIK